MNLIKELGELAYGTRLRLLAERFIHDGSKIYQSQNMDFEPRWFTMFYLLSKGTPLSISDITDELGYTQPAVTQIANLLKNKGLIKIVKDKSDTRKKLLALSTKGLELLPQLKKIWACFEEAVKELLKETGYDMLLITGKIEDALDQKDMFTRVSEKIKQKQNEAIEIVEYKPEYKTYFRDLNYEWLDKYFSIEKVDRKILNNPEKEIIKHGGDVVFAKSNNEIVGTAALVKYNSRTYELVKMAVRENERGKQVGKKLTEFVINKARQKKATILFLDTSPKLNPALNLYKKMGFEQVEFSEVSKYKRFTIRLALKL